MVLSWSKRRVFRRGHKGQDLTGASTLDVEFVVPTHFRCPITLDLMTDPVTLPTGITYDRDSIEKWLESGNRTCPVTNQPLTTFDIIPNHTIRRMIQEWCVQNRSYGIERIPTPRIPVTHYEVSEVCAKIMSATQRGDHTKCEQLVHKIKFWSKESDRNKKSILQNGAAATSLANAFSFFSNVSIEKNIGLLEEILGVLTWILPKGQESCYMLSSESSLRCMVWFMNSKDLTSRQNAVVLVMKQVPIEPLAKTEGIVEALVKMIKEPVGPSATKASLKVIFQMVSSSSCENNKEKVIKRCMELGLVNLLVEALVDGDRGVCERALGILDRVCDYKEGKEVGKANVLTLPLVVKKILRVSGLASEFGVSILWKLCCEKIDEDMVKEALQVGAFQKVLVLLQVGCEDKTKAKATDLLKLLNAHKNTVECVGSSLDNLKYLKKPF